MAVGLLICLGGCLLAPEDKAYLALTAREKYQQQVYKLYPGSQRPPGELAILLMGDVPSVSIDGLDVGITDYQAVHLLPGQHTVSLRWQWFLNQMEKTSKRGETERTIETNLAAGHTYILFTGITLWHHQCYFWIEDVNSGDVVGGRKKP